MTSLIRPFDGFVPTSDLGHRVVGPHRSMISEDELARARHDRLSFRYNAGRGAGATHDEVRAWLEEARGRGALRGAEGSVLVYRVTQRGSTATGILADVSVGAFDSGWIKPHEATLAKTEAKMARYMRAAQIYGNPVALAHRPDERIAEAITRRTRREADHRFTTADGSAHELWTVEGGEAAAVCAAFEGPLYVIDGHHRLVAASRAARDDDLTDPYLPACVFSADQLDLRAYRWDITDPTIDPARLVEQLRERHDVEPTDESSARPRRRREVGLVVGGEHFRLTLRPEAEPGDQSAALDVNLLQQLVLEPILGIVDRRHDRRLRFVADLPGAEADAPDCTVSFLPFPLSVDDVLAAADDGQTMPPKSTWFAPKLPSGLVIRLREEL